MKEKFSEVLKTLIKNKGITQTALAKTLGLKPNVISMYCNGYSKPEFKTLIKIADFFDVSLDSLVFGVRPENKIIADELGLSDNALENLKEIAIEGGGADGVSAYIDELLSNRSFYETLIKALADRDAAANFIISVEAERKEKISSSEKENLIASIETPAIIKMSNFFSDSRIFSIENMKDKKMKEKILRPDFSFLEHKGE